MTYRTYADLGGQDVRGAIVQEPEGELFHAPWEPRVMALVVAMGPTGLSNIDMNRAARETLPRRATASNACRPASFGTLIFDALAIIPFWHMSPRFFPFLTL